MDQINCKICGKKTNGDQFCSPVCFDKYNNQKTTLDKFGVIAKC